jgi:uncharacterized membrane protein
MGWYALAGAIFLAGLSIAAVLVWRFVAAYEPPSRFLAPGEVRVSLAASGDYIIWHEHRTVYEGRSFDVPPAMPGGTRYRVQAPDGKPIAVEPFAGMTSEAAEGRSVSVAHFEAPLGGLYRVAVEGPTEPRVLAVAPNRVWPIAKLVVEVLVIGIAALGLAVAVGLYGFLRAVEAPAAGALGAQAETRLRTLAGLVYGLQAASMLVGVTLFAGVIINYLKRAEAAGTWLESHYTWQIRTFWWSLAWCVIGIATAVLIVGFIVLLGSAVWFVYRIVKGWTELNEGRPMYA